MKKRIILVLMALLVAGVSCNKQYDDRIAALRERSAALHKADAETRKMLTDEMNRLSGDVDDMLAAMEERVLAYLEEMVKKVEVQILDQSSMLSLTIKNQSDKLGADIVAWRNNLDDFLARNKETFISSRNSLQAELNKAIAASDYTMVSRIRTGIRQLDNLERTFVPYVQGIQKRVDSLKDMEKVYADTKKSMSDLTLRKNDMLAALDEYEERIQAIVQAKLDNEANSNLAEAVDGMLELYDTANTLYEESNAYLSDIESFYSDIPDIESMLSDAEALLDRCSDLEGSLDDMDESYVEDILTYLQDAIDAAAEGDVSFSDVESTYDEVLGNMHDFLEDSNYVMDLMDETISLMEDRLTDVEDCISALE